MNFFLGFLWSLFLLLFLLTLLLVAWCCHLFNAFIFFKAFAISNASYNIYSFAPSCFFFLKTKKKGQPPCRCQQHSLSLSSIVAIKIVARGSTPPFFVLFGEQLIRLSAKFPPWSSSSPLEANTSGVASLFVFF